MSGLFAYARVAPASKPTAAAELRKAAASAGHMVQPDNTVVETVASSVAVFARLSWRGLLDQMHGGDVLVVSALCDLGRDVKEVCATVKELAARGLRVYCLGLGQAQVDLAGPAGRSTMNVLAAVADFDDQQRAERERLRTKSDKTLPPVRRKGRPLSLSPVQITEARRLLTAGVSTAQIARRLETSRQTIMRACAGFKVPVTATAAAASSPSAR